MWSWELRKPSTEISMWPTDFTALTEPCHLLSRKWIIRPKLSISSLLPSVKIFCLKIFYEILWLNQWELKSSYSSHKAFIQLIINLQLQNESWFDTFMSAPVCDRAENPTLQHFIWSFLTGKPPEEGLNAFTEKKKQHAIRVPHTGLRDRRSRNIWIWGTMPWISLVPTDLALWSDSLSQHLGGTNGLLPTKWHIFKTLTTHLLSMWLYADPPENIALPPILYCISNSLYSIEFVYISTGPTSNVPK